MIEEWRDIQGYEGYYQVSSEGRVRSLDRVVDHSVYGKQPIKGKILKSKPGNHGYLSVMFCKKNKRKRHSIHRLVAAAFIPIINDKPWTNHRNGIKIDNRVENLEWCTPSENNKHAYATGLKFPKTHLTWVDVLIIRDFKKRNLLPTRKIAQIFKTSNHVITAICRYDKFKNIP